MKEHFLRSSKLVNQYFWLVILVGVFHVSISSGLMAYFSLLGLIVAFFLTIVVNARITLQVERKDEIPYLQIIKDNWINYLIATLVLGAMIFLLTNLIKLLPLPAELLIVTKEAAKAIVWVISIYVMPIVFLKKLGFVSVVAGISYFFGNIKQSALIIPFVVTMFFINAVGYLWLISKMQSGVNIMFSMATIMVINTVTTYLSFVVFTAACFVLVESRGKGSSDVHKA